MIASKEKAEKELNAMGINQDFFEEIEKPREGEKIEADNLEGGEQQEDDEEELENLQDEFKQVDQEDLLLAKAALYFFDDSRAALLSAYAHKDINHTKDYIYYKDLDDDRSQILLRAISIYTRQWRLGQSPLLIILIALVISTVTMFYKARQAKKEREEQEEAKHLEELRAKEAQKAKAEPKKEKGNIRKIGVL